MKKYTKLAMPLLAGVATAPLVGLAGADVAHAGGSERVITAYTTGYTWFDNTPVGSAEIAHPVIHSSAGGTGTYQNPITLATATGRFPAGTRFYVPNMRRYFIAEDIGGNQMHNPPAGASAWLDLWIDGQGGSASGANRCAMAITGNHKVIVNPRPGYAVQAGRVYTGTCHGNFGERVVGGSVTSSVKATKPATKAKTVKAKTTKAKTVKSPAGRASAHGSHVVRSGDTLSKIARKHGTTWQKLYQLNRGTLHNPNMLKVGQRLVLG
ncbi:MULTISPECIES: LysM peptidoglycan-binding domain-containing protein [unclassified Luteococcus]|uniref:LysM peptidoglycan-binding domain-containing protein n=1 Tax=unclassified Luteococcus TaxID=2639923 RepID=UPI00313ED32F